MFYIKEFDFSLIPKVELDEPKFEVVKEIPFIDWITNNYTKFWRLLRINSSLKFFTGLHI